MRVLGVDPGLTRCGIGVVGAVTLARHRRDAFIDELPHDELPDPDPTPADEVTS